MDMFATLNTEYTEPLQDRGPRAMLPSDVILECMNDKDPRDAFRDSLMNVKHAIDKLTRYEEIHGVCCRHTIGMDDITRFHQMDPELADGHQFQGMSPLGIHEHYTAGIFSSIWEGIKAAIRAVLNFFVKIKNYIMDHIRARKAKAITKEVEEVVSKLRKKPVTKDFALKGIYDLKMTNDRVKFFLDIYNYLQDTIKQADTDSISPDELKRNIERWFKNNADSKGVAWRNDHLVAMDLEPIDTTFVKSGWNNVSVMQETGDKIAAMDKQMLLLADTVSHKYDEFNKLEKQMRRTSGPGNDAKLNALSNKVRKYFTLCGLMDCMANEINRFRNIVTGMLKQVDKGVANQK